MKIRTLVYLGIVLTALSVSGFMLIVSWNVLEDTLGVIYYDMQFKNNEIVEAFNLKYEKYVSVNPAAVYNGYIRYGFFTEDYQRLFLHIGPGPHDTPIVWIECKEEYKITSNLLDYIQNYDCFVDDHPEYAIHYTDTIADNPEYSNPMWKPTDPIHYGTDDYLDGMVDFVTSTDPYTVRDDSERSGAFW